MPGFPKPEFWDGNRDWSSKADDDNFNRRPSAYTGPLGVVAGAGQRLAGLLLQPPAPKADFASHEPVTPQMMREALVRPSKTPAVTAAQLRAIFPKSSANFEDFVGPLTDTFAKYGINTPFQRAAFLAQAGHESAQFQKLREDLYYKTAERLAETYPSRFNSPQAAVPYTFKPEATGNYVYSGRMGNGAPDSGDGYRFRGGGLLQITGRDAYRAAGYEMNPEIVSQPIGAANAAGYCWNSRHLNDLTGEPLTKEEFDDVTRRINPALKGAQERWRFYQDGVNVLAR